MMKVLTLVLALALPLAATAQQTTEVKFTAPSPTAVFQVRSLVVENSGLAVTSEFTEVMKRLELLTLAPSTVTLANGDYWLNWGGTEDFSQSFYLKAQGEPIEVRLIGSRQAAFVALVVAAAGSIGLAATVPIAGTSGPGPWIVGGLCAATSLGGLVALALEFPRIEIR